MLVLAGVLIKRHQRRPADPTAWTLRDSMTMWLASKLDVLQPVGDLLSKPTSMLPLFCSMLVNHALLGISL